MFSQEGKEPRHMEKDEKVIEIPFRNIDTVGPAGSINSNVVEMASWKYILPR